MSKDHIYVSAGSPSNFIKTQLVSSSHATPENAHIFSHWIANCSCTPQSSLFALEQDSGECIYQVDQYMLITNDYEYLILQYCLEQVNPPTHSHHNSAICLQRPYWDQKRNNE